MKLFESSSFKYFFALLALLLFFNSCGNGNDEVKSNTLVVATIEAEQSSEYTISQSYVGQVEAARKSRVGFEIGGMLEQIPVDEGDIVQKGDVLAELDTERLQARRSELLATRDQAQANMELAQITRQRNKEALDLNAVSFQDYDAADKNYKAQKASLEQAQSAVKTVDVDIEKSKIKAPFNAIISKRFLDEGEVIQPGEEVFEILEKTSPEVRVGLASAAAESINVDDEISVTVNGNMYRSKVKSVLPTRSQNTRTVDMILSLEEDFDTLRDGDLANITIDRSISNNGFWLPITALTESSRGLWSCYVAIPLNSSDEKAEATHKLERRELELLHQESDRVYVQGTISGGDLIISEGVHRLVPGLIVKVTPPVDVSGGTK